MKELIDKLIELNYSKEFISYVENNNIGMESFEIPNFDYESLNQISHDTSELILKESQEPQSNFYYVNKV